MRILGVTAVVVTGLIGGAAWAEVISDVANTKHNLSISGQGPVKASSGAEDQICIFCHTPHAATPGVSPLWNRALSGVQTYDVYTSSSLDAESIQQGFDRQPGGSSKLCLSCHDGTMALGTVNVRGGQANVTINLAGTPDGKMPPGEGDLSGFTRNLGGVDGTDLTNDHPISITYNQQLVDADGELTNPTNSIHIAVRAPGIRPSIPLENTDLNQEGQIQCASCHDPHIRDTALPVSIKFLRLKRFQEGPPADGSFTPASDIVCLGCHEKDGWAASAHARVDVADEVYTAEAATLREFPAGLEVWRAACLNCHDTHTVSGARRLLREGVYNASNLPGGSNLSPKQGGEPALEETCYQCHSSVSALQDITDVKDIAGDFALPRRMPIATADQAATTEIHDIIDNDLIEPETLLGKGIGNEANRHAECTDCHNPHRLIKDRLFNGAGSDTQATHDHTAAPHSNLASGALRGSWGVEPEYLGGEQFLDLPSNYVVKRGLGTGTLVTDPHVTREYQICLKCHSDFAYADNGVYPIGTRPNLGSSGGGTPLGTNDLDQYTNQAMEFQAPIGDRGELGGNHRSWHPVIDITGRDGPDRGMAGSFNTTNMFLAPWNGASVGNQTMYCSDCHGTETVPGTAVPSGNNAWGPHGSTQNFILKGSWDGNTGTDDSGICFRCHSHANYATDVERGDRDGFQSGFGGPDRDTNLHAFHAQQVNQNLKCTWCHVAVPHGWKNKAFLVNLNDVGLEAGQPPGTEVSIANDAEAYTQGPYYLNAKLKILNFATSGQWVEADCGSASGASGGGIGVDWMGNVCSNPP